MRKGKRRKPAEQKTAENDQSDLGSTVLYCRVQCCQLAEMLEKSKILWRLNKFEADHPSEFTRDLRVKRTNLFPRIQQQQWEKTRKKDVSLHVSVKILPIMNEIHFNSKSNSHSDSFDS